MNTEKANQLYEKFPKILNNIFLEVDDGWYDVIYILCKTIQNHIKYSRQRRVIDLLRNRAVSRAQKGDTYLLNKLYKPSYASTVLESGMIKVEPACHQVVATQVKEKFGTLRFYYYGGDDYVRGAVSTAEAMTYRICEACGNPGRARNNSWIRVVCDKHAPEYGIQEFYDDECE